MFGLFGGKHKKLDAEFADLISKAKAELAQDSLEGRQQAFHLLIGGLEKAEEEDFPDRNMEMFMLLGDVFVQSKDWEQALNAYSDAIAANDGQGIGNEHLHLRLGKARFELGHEDRASDELCRAYMGGGKEIFEGEDPRYFAFLKTKIEPGPNGW
jgi:tetratricopeptide (TPR) repeat protein